MNHTEFLPHGSCLLWTLPLVAAIILGEFAVFIAYFWIPLELWRALRRGRVSIAREARTMLVGFALFIVFCGSGHLISIILLWHPWYWFAAGWTLCTGAISCAVAYRIHNRMDLYAALVAEPVNYAMLIEELQSCKRRIIELERN